MSGACGACACRPSAASGARAPGAVGGDRAGAVPGGGLGEARGGGRGEGPDGFRVPLIARGYHGLFGVLGLAGEGPRAGGVGSTSLPAVRRTERVAGAPRLANERMTDRPTERTQDRTSRAEESLLARVAAGEPSAVRDVLDRYGGLVWSLARRMTTSQADAEDAVQDIFIELWKNAERFDPAVASEATFIAVIARRRLIDRRRKQTRRIDGARLPESFEVADTGGVPRRSPEELGEDARAAMAALQRLSQDQQKVLQLSIFYGLSHERISQVTGLPLGTVKTHARRGLIRVREMLNVTKDAPNTPGGEAST